MVCKQNLTSGPLTQHDKVVVIKYEKVGRGCRENEDIVQTLGPASIRIPGKGWLPFPGSTMLLNGH